VTHLATLAVIEFIRHGRLRSCVNLRELERNGHRIDA